MDRGTKSIVHLQGLWANDSIVLRATQLTSTQRKWVVRTSLVASANDKNSSGALRNSSILSVEQTTTFHPLSAVTEACLKKPSLYWRRVSAFGPKTHVALGTVRMLP